MMGMDTLLALQGVDTGIDRASARRTALESGETLAAARAEADTAEAVVGELRLQVDELGRDQMRFEHEIDSLTQKEAAESKRMYDGSVANAKELEAMQHETESLKRRRSEREDELLVLLEQREELDARVTAAETVAAGRRAEVDRTAMSAADELVGVTAELERLTAERAALAARIDPELLELYEDLRRQKKGVGAATLVDGVCSGCHEQLSSMQLDKLKRTEGVRRCEHCRRILVF
jgi:predicted  nucleic acid-binding Zn-ribbon protein